MLAPAVPAPGEWWFCWFRPGVSVTDGFPQEFRQSAFTPILTAREMQVLACLVTGRTNREIGKELSIAESTVKSHVISIFGKFGVSTRVEAAIVGWETFPMLRALASDRPLRMVRAV